MTSNNAPRVDQSGDAWRPSLASFAELAALSDQYLDLATAALAELAADPDSVAIERAVGGALLVTAVEARLDRMGRALVTGRPGAGKSKRPAWLDEQIAARAAEGHVPGPRNGS